MSPNTTPRAVKAVAACATLSSAGCDCALIDGLPPDFGLAGVPSKDQLSAPMFVASSLSAEPALYAAQTRCGAGGQAVKLLDGEKLAWGASAANGSAARRLCRQASLDFA